MSKLEDQDKYMQKMGFVPYADFENYCLTIEEKLKVEEMVSYVLKHLDPNIVAKHGSVTIANILRHHYSHHSFLPCHDLLQAFIAEQKDDLSTLFYILEKNSYFQICKNHILSEGGAVQIKPAFDSTGNIYKLNCARLYYKPHV